MKKMDLEVVKAFIEMQSPETKVYLGADSERFKQDGVWWAAYSVVVVVHIDGNHGCKVFGEIVTERDYDQRKDRPAMRLMNEVYKVSEMFQKLKDVLEDRYVEVHIDINPNKMHGSSCVIDQAIGYIKGTCNITPMVKPDSPAASFGADHFKQILAMAK
jgi:predicted RNase H-related nuclease YkuK (DUF458 family)